LPLTLASANEIIILYLLYFLLIFILKSVAVGIRFKKGENDFTKQLDAEVSRSLLRCCGILSVHLLAGMCSWELGVDQICMIAIWLLLAELNIVFCGLLSKGAVFRSLQLFGVAIEVILVVGQLARLVNFDFFNIL
jgi:hypothetical protein